MPFLFVDYDQGAGGERFCAGLSENPKCERLGYQQFDNGRTKVHDVFAQEFLKPIPDIEIKKSHPELYTIVPTHRRTDLARSLLEDVYSIRIQRPRDKELHLRMVEQQIKKVLLTREPTPEYFFGLLKILSKSAADKSFVRKVKYDMLTVEIILLSQNIDPTPDAVEKYLSDIKNTSEVEPDQHYDLVIPYEHLVRDPTQVQTALYHTFGITVSEDCLASYA
jgi:hypothetical protein